MKKPLEETSSAVLSARAATMDNDKLTTVKKKIVVCKAKKFLAKLPAPASEEE